MTGAMSSKWAKGTGGPAGDECYNLVAHTLRADGFDASEDGTGRGVPLVTAFDTTQITHPENRCQPQPGDPSHPLAAGAHAPAIAFNWQQGGATALGMGLPGVPPVRANQTLAVAIQGATGGARGQNGAGIGGDLAFSLDTTGAQGVSTSGVRRLTPRECERLQGFPDDWTAIPGMADGPRYKCLGNAVTVNVAEWIGQRLYGAERALRVVAPPRPLTADESEAYGAVIDAAFDGEEVAP